MKKKCPDCGFQRPLDDFHVSRTSRDGRQGYCREHQRRRAVECGWRAQGMIDMTWDRFCEMKENRGNRCEICSRTPTEAGHPDRELAVDHDKSTGIVRGLLCIPCNAGIGMLQHHRAVLHGAMEYLGRYAG